MPVSINGTGSVTGLGLSSFSGGISNTQLPSGSVVAVHAVVNSTRTDISGTGVRSYAWGSFTKARADTNLVFSGTLMFKDNESYDSDATGLYVGFQSSSMGSELRKRTLSRIDVTGNNFRERFGQCTGYIPANEIPYAQSVNVRWGTSTTGSYIAQWWNPNSGDDGRYDGQRESTLLIWEVAP
jgi:hypothetical protein